jgi:hypothetical protein
VMLPLQKGGWHRCIRLWSSVVKDKGDKKFVVFVGFV